MTEGTTVKKPRAKVITREELDAMFKKHDEEMAKKIDSMCDSCAHHECTCPAKIEALDKYTEHRMDKLDENDELLRANINRLAELTFTDMTGLSDNIGKESEARAALEERLNEEHRLREMTESELRAIRKESEKLKKESEKLSKDLDEANDKVSKYKVAVDRNSSDVMKLGAITGAVLGVGLVVVALAMAGVF